MEIPFSRTEYNADHAQIGAKERMKYKGPSPKSGKHHALVQRISLLILERRYSPYAVLKTLEKEKRQLGSRLFRLIFLSITFDNGAEFADVPGLGKSILPRGKGPYCISPILTAPRNVGQMRIITESSGDSSPRGPTSR